MPKTKIFSDAELDQLFQNSMDDHSQMIRRLRQTSMDDRLRNTTSQVPAGIPSKFLNLFATTIGKDALLKTQKSEKWWIFSVRADKFEVKFDDFKKYVSFGMIGIRFDKPNTILLYFKQ